MRLSSDCRYTRLSMKVSLVGAILALTSPVRAMMAQHPAGALVAEREIRLAEKARFEAMIRADLPALDTLLGSDLSYTHTDGDRQTRSQFVAMLRSNELAYLSAQPESVVVRVYGTTVLADGRAHMRVRSGGKEIAFTIRFLEAYVHRRGRWELVAWQSTRIGDVSQ